MDIKGKVTVFKNEKNGKEWYTISDGSKNIDNEWTNKSWIARFKGEVPEHKSKIEISGFTTYWKKDNIVNVTIQVLEWKYLDTQTKVFLEDESIPF